MQRLRKAYAAAWELYACRQLQGWTWKCWGIACQGVPSFALISCYATLHILVGNDGSRCHFAKLAGQALGPMQWRRLQHSKLCFPLAVASEHALPSSLPIRYVMEFNPALCFVGALRNGHYES
jgi:hypothetical protein